MDTRAQRGGRILRHRFIWLFGLLLAFFVLLPAFHQAGQTWRPALTTALENASFVVLLGAAALSVSRGRAWVPFALGLGMPALVLWIGMLVADSAALAVARQSFGAAFLGYVIWAVLAYIFSCRAVTFDTICAALCVYVLLGIVWALAYSVLDMLVPGAFACTLPGQRGTPVLQVGRGETAVLYFSFATLTTLGYGDFVPTLPLSRMLAVVEAIAGQLYLTVLVARLVGLEIAESVARRMGNQP
jgi:hypothetical protein